LYAKEKCRQSCSFAEPGIGCGPGETSENSTGFQALSSLVKSHRDDLLLEYASPAQFLFLFFSGAAPDLSTYCSALARAAEKQKENNLWRFGL
jgi:hypothetical protein